MKKDILDRYARNSEGKLIIDINAGKIEDIYNDYDKYAPYVRKELDQDLVEYIIDCVNEIGNEDFIIRFHIIAFIDNALMVRVDDSIHNYFIYLSELERSELKNILKKALTFITIGAVIMALSIWLNELTHESVIRKVFAEGLTVAAWVSLWEALATFIINWPQQIHKIKMFERIAKADVFFHQTL